MNTFYISHHSGQCLASNVNEDTVRKILRNVGPVACRVGSETEPDDELNGVEWLIDNPGSEITDSKIRFDMLDFTGAWEIQNTIGTTLNHHPDCSSVEGSNRGMGGPGLLCDCGAVIREWLRMKDEKMGITDDDLRSYLPTSSEKTADARVRAYRTLRNGGYEHNEAYDAAKQILHVG